MVRFVLALSVVALCLVMPGVFSQKCRNGGLCEQSTSTGKTDADIWLFHFGPNSGPREEYINPLTGEVSGYLPDVLNAVCEIAEKSCQIVFDQQSNCWDSVDETGIGGVGLFNFYYDACVGWYPTIPRLRTFQFSDAMSKGVFSGFGVEVGNPGGFDPADLTGKKIGFIRGYFSDKNCIARQGDAIAGSLLSEDQVALFNTFAEVKEALMAGDIDAAFESSRNTFDNDDELEFLNADNPIECTDGGAALMMRKDNPLKSWFNPALQELLESDKYQEVCNGLTGVHGDRPGGEPEDVCL